MAGWHHWLNGRESGWTPGVGDGQGGLACCNSRGHKESDMTEQLNWTVTLGWNNQMGPIKLISVCTAKETIKQNRRTTYRMGGNICLRKERGQKWKKKVGSGRKSKTCSHGQTSLAPPRTCEEWGFRGGHWYWGPCLMYTLISGFTPIHTHTLKPFVLFLQLSYFSEKELGACLYWRNTNTDWGKKKRTNLSHAKWSTDMWGRTNQHGY